MALSEYLVHECVTERATETRGNAGEVVQTWADHLSGQECRLIVKSERIASPAGLLMATTYKLLLPAGTDVLVSDRVRTITLDDGSTVGPFTVEQRLPRMGRSAVSHMAVMLEKVT
jgi:hypothetical protein